ncbi:MAG: hypothetical protein GX366_02640 [Epulopiscium sp.]|nr:hypothetical protein [Candidatus Epulonipiscium sp.]
MNIKLQYQESKNLNINNISVIGDFNDFNPAKGQMEKLDDIWIFEGDLPEGKYKYRFLINDELELNDPLANMYYPDDNEKLWSVLMINEDGERLYNNKQYSVHIENYNINSTLNERENTNKKTFNLLLDTKVVTRFEFTDISGIHSLTTAWYSPDGELFQVSEENLFKPEGQQYPIKTWFWMDLDSKKRTIPKGLWTIKLFLNGEFILEDKFTID